jgi:hypothetical protein
LALYALLWFAGLFACYGEACVEVRDGRDVWVRDGAVLGAMSPRDARWANARMLSGFSAAWIAFALPLAHRRRAARRRQRTPPPTRAA